MFKVTWIAGMPRAGSMWTFNVVRELAKRAGFCALPDEVKFNDQEWADYANREVGANRDPDTVFVLKMHAYLKQVPTDNFVITNIRDIRDAIVSYMRFMHVDFDKALTAAETSVSLADHYLSLPEDHRMVLRYHDITTAPAAAVTRIANRLGLEIDDVSATDIAAEFSKEKVKALIESRDRRFRASVESGRTSFDELLLARADGVPVTMDRSTGFQSDHVSDYRDGDWRQLLSEDQINVMNQSFGSWLTRLGYAA